MSQLPSIKNNSGFTLIEVMVSILIMMVGMLGVLETISVSLQHNTKNQLRDEAVSVGERYMAGLRGKTFENLSTSYTVVNVESKVRGASKIYSVERSTQILASDSSSNPTSQQLTVVVKWAFKNISSQNRVVSVVSKQ